MHCGSSWVYFKTGAVQRVSDSLDLLLTSTTRDPGRLWELVCEVVVLIRYICSCNGAILCRCSSSESSILQQPIEIK